MHACVYLCLGEYSEDSTRTGEEGYGVDVLVVQEEAGWLRVQWEKGVGAAFTRAICGGDSCRRQEGQEARWRKGCVLAIQYSISRERENVTYIVAEELTSRF